MWLRNSSASPSCLESLLTNEKIETKSKFRKWSSLSLSLTHTHTHSHTQSLSLPLSQSLILSLRNLKDVSKESFFKLNKRLDSTNKQKWERFKRKQKNSVFFSWEKEEGKKSFSATTIVTIQISKLLWGQWRKCGREVKKEREGFRKKEHKKTT